MDRISAAENQISMRCEDGVLGVDVWKNYIAYGGECRISVLEQTESHENSVFVGDKDIAPSFSNLVAFTTGTPILCVSVSEADEKLLVCAGCKNGKIQCFARAGFDSNVETSTFEGHSSYVNSVAVNNSCTQIASCCDDCTCRIWDLETETCERNFSLGSPTIAVQWNKNSPRHVFVGESEGKITVFDIQNNSHALTLHTGSILYDDVVLQDMDVSGFDSLWVGAVGSSGNFYIWDLRRPDSPVDIAPAHAGGADIFRWSRTNSKRFATSGNTQVKLWDIENGNALSEQSVTSRITCLNWSTDQDWFIAGHHKTLSIHKTS